MGHLLVPLSGIRCSMPSGVRVMAPDESGTNPPSMAVVPFSDIPVRKFLSLTGATGTSISRTESQPLPHA